MKKRAITSLKVVGAYLVLLLMVEGGGQLVIRYLESRKPTGIEAEHLMSYQEPLLGFGLKKNLDVNLTHWRVHTNRWGFRDTDNFEREKPANEKRVFLIGGSTVFGWGVNEDQSLKYYLELNLDEMKKKSPGTNVNVRFVNAGVPWYASWHEAAYIYFRVLDFNPDAVIILDGLNDTALGVATNWAPLYAGYVDRPTQIAYEKKKSGQGEKWWLDLLHMSPTFSYFHARAKEKEAAAVGVYRPEVWDQYLTTMNRLVTMLNAHKIPVKFFYQPVQGIDKPISHYEWTHNGTSMAQASFAKTFKKQYLEGERRLLESKLNVTSLKSIFKETKKTIYLDGLHYNSLGNDYIAKEMFNVAVAPWVKEWSKERTPRLSLRGGP